MEEDQQYEQPLELMSALFCVCPHHFRHYTGEELDGSQEKEEQWYLSAKGLIGHVNIIDILCSHKKTVSG